MNTKRVPASKITAITTKVVGLLESLDHDEIHKVISASLTLLGTSTRDGLSAHGTPAEGQGAGGTDKPGHAVEGISQRGNTWMRQNNLTPAQIQEVFEIGGGEASVIASEVPGKNSKEKTHNAYVLRGLSQLLVTGEATFNDKSARKLCEDLGCLNAANHATYMSDKKRRLRPLPSFPA